jgi:hypothetical protein
MDEILKNEIIKLYKNGIGSTSISKKLNIPKYKILKLLKDLNLTRKRDRCTFLDIKKEGNIFYLFWTCKICKKEIKRTCNNKSILCRNHYNHLKKDSVCKKCLALKMVGVNNPFYGKKHKEGTKKQISENRKGKGVGEKNAMANKEHVEKLKKIIKDKWANGEFDYLREGLSNSLKKTRRLGKIKSAITSKKEFLILNMIKNLNYAVIHSYRVDTKICDFYIPSLNLIIEYFGDYWHCNPKKFEKDYFNQKKGMTAKEIWEYDNLKLELIKNFGYNLEVIWESDLKNNNKLLLSVIDKYAKHKNFAP